MPKYCVEQTPWLDFEWVGEIMTESFFTLLNYNFPESLSLPADPKNHVKEIDSIINHQVMVVLHIVLKYVLMLFQIQLPLEEGFICNQIVYGFNINAFYRFAQHFNLKSLLDVGDFSFLVHMP